MKVGAFLRTLNTYFGAWTWLLVFVLTGMALYFFTPLQEPANSLLNDIFGPILDMFKMAGSLDYS